MTADGERRADELDRLRRALYAREVPPGATERYRALLRDAAAPTAEPLAVGPRSRAGARRLGLAALGAVLCGVGVGVALLAPPVLRDGADAEAALVAPAAAGTRVWSAHGVGSLPSSPVLEAPGTPVVVALACRGRGAIVVLVDQQDRRVPCAAGRVRRDSEYFVGHHGRFTIALSVSAPVEWVLTVTAVGAG